MPEQDTEQVFVISDLQRQRQISEINKSIYNDKLAHCKRI